MLFTWSSLEIFPSCIIPLAVSSDDDFLFLTSLHTTPAEKINMIHTTQTKNQYELRN